MSLFFQWAIAFFIEFISVPRSTNHFSFTLQERIIVQTFMALNVVSGVTHPFA